MTRKTELIELFSAAIADDIMNNMGEECDIIRDALLFFLENASLEELQDMYKTRAMNV